MIILLLLVILLVLVALGVPIGFALGIAGSVYFLLGDPTLLMMLPERLFGGMNSSALMALPLFTMMGLFMNEAHLTTRMINTLNLLVGKIRGALGITNVLVSMVFGGISGSSVSDTASVGNVLIPEMQRKGYSREFSTGITVASSTMGMVIPPSVPMLIYASISNDSVGKLFMGGLLPGILVGVFQCIITYIYAKREKVPLETVELTPEYVKKTLKEGVFAIIMPIFVIGLIVTGVVTATEAAAIGALYALLVGVFIYRSLSLKAIFRILRETVRLTTSVMIVIAFSNMFTWIMTLEGLPEKISVLVAAMNLNSVTFLLLLTVIILIAGMFLDVSPVILLLTPVFLPAALSCGVSSITFGVLMIVGTALGLVTPPVGMCLNVASTISELRITTIFKSAIPFLLGNLIVLLMICTMPFISQWLPSFINL